MQSTKFSSFKSENFVIADAHVHIHDCFSLQTFFDRALHNFILVTTNLGRQYSSNGILFLTECNGMDYFEKLKKHSHGTERLNNLENWTIQLTKENSAIFISQAEGKGFYIIAGRQIVTSANLEILALACTQNIDDCLNMNQTISQIIDGGAIPVIPWGVGKWLGKRGKLVTHLLPKYKHSFLYLGDNSGRPVFWPTPKCFKIASNYGLKVLPGSDPLPFPTEVSRPGSFGFIAEGKLSRGFPVKSVKSILKNLEHSPFRYGNLEGPFRFFKHQTLMQLKKAKSR